MLYNHGPLGHVSIARAVSASKVHEKGIKVPLIILVDQVLRLLFVVEHPIA